MSELHRTICWDCAKQAGKCSWSKKFIPVEGWKAKPTKLKAPYPTKSQKYTDSFDVYECPEFELLERLRK